MVCRFKERIPTRRGRRTRARVDFHAYDKPADGCKAGWTHAKCAPRRGELPMGWRRINIGNRKTANEEADEATNYDANALNQYTAVGEFAPEFDVDGNQTRVQTSTGIWNVTYNAENRPTVFSRENEDGTTTQVTCAYDYMGRRATKKVETITTNTETEESTASTTLNQRYLYRGYLQAACCDLTRSAHPCLWLITWEPTQQIATCPLAIQKDATWYVYGWDMTKNVCEVFSNSGIIKTTYSYTPYGAVTAEGSVTQPIQWSSEFYDEEMGLVYYNYRHYNSTDGRWLGRDPLTEASDKHLYRIGNPSMHFDYLGMVYGIYYMREATFTGHAWIQMDNTSKGFRVDFPEDKLKTIDPDISYLSFYMPEAIGFYPIRETEQRTWLETFVMIIIPFYVLKGKIKKDAQNGTGELEKYKHLFFMSEKNGNKVLMFNAGQFDTTLIADNEEILQHGNNTDKFGGKVCCSQLDGNSSFDRNRVLSCIRARAEQEPEYYNLYVQNCMHVAERILKECCLSVNESQMRGADNQPITTLKVRWSLRKN